MLNASSTNVLQAPSILSLIRANCCTTCLSSDRRLYPIKAYLPELRYLCKEVSFSADNTICYECKAIITKILTFRQRAVEAMNVLLSLGQVNSLKKGAEINIDSLSSLTCSNIKNTFDAEYDLTDNIIPIELKKESDEEASIKLENEDTSDGISDDDDREPLSGHKMEGSPVDAETPLSPWKVEAESVSAECKEEQEQSDDNEPSKSLVSENKPLASRKLSNSLIYSNTDHQPSSSLAENERAYDIKTFSSEAELTAYREASKKPTLAGRVYKCETCIIAFSKKELFDKHMELHDKQRGPFMCRFCELRFTLRSACEEHVNSHYRHYTCRFCAYRHHSESQMQWHIRRYHKAHECRECNIKFTRYYTYNKHLKRVHGEVIQCDFCSKIFTAKEALKRHITNIHQGLAPVYECNVCEKKYKSKVNFKNHTKAAHSTNDDAAPPAYCVDCKQHFKNESILKLHLQMSKKHAAPRYECDHCGVKSVNKAGLQYHIDSTHMKIPRYECETCDQKFITIISLRRHKQNAHGGKKAAVKKHVCHVCGKEFTVRKSLEEHLNTHSGLRPFKCNVCGDTFAYSAALYTHNKLKHLKIKPESWKKKKKKTAN
ncbi:zinc finger protein 62 homolog isoform X2 [Plutella xylostella]|uniref:zinc finger protein 62 homolog isoform X2 n=1 Tax=Plutella xylostella TaxID=51655 RepID=UPI002032FDF6|nr:zinc finger protein 62 homolog isoform X2 [Plutella xylostella]